MPAKRANKSGKKGRPIQGPRRLRRQIGATRPRRAPGGRMPTGNSTTKVIKTFAPAAFGSIVPRSTFNFNGPAQHLSEYDSRGSLRVTGTDLFSIPIAAPAGGFGAFNASLIGPYWAPLSPATISPRLQAVEEMFQYYAIRRLRVTYIPSTSSATADSLALGYAVDYRISTAIATPTTQQVIELSPAVLTTVWQPAAMEIKHTGTKSWECYLSSESVDQRFQGILAARLAQGNVTGAVITYGYLFLEYDIDFYQPVALLSSVDLSKVICRKCHRPPVPGLMAPSIVPYKNHTTSLPEVPLSAFPVEGKMMMEPDDDSLESPTPPRYVPAPSTVLGTTGWFGSGQPPLPTPGKKTSNK
jgi:hypothetical protein